MPVFFWIHTFALLRSSSFITAVYFANVDIVTCCSHRFATCRLCCAVTCRLSCRGYLPFSLQSAAAAPARVCLILYFLQKPSRVLKFLKMSPSII